MKAVKGNRYDKYIDWVQPVLTSDTDQGCTVTCSASFSGYPAYKAMDGSKTDCWFPNTKTGWWQIKFPHKILITGLTHIAGNYNSQTQGITGRYYTSSSKTTPIGDEFSGTYAQGTVINISNIPADGILTDTIYFEKIGGSGTPENSGIGELIITAKQVLPSSNYKLPTKTVTKYFKWGSPNGTVKGSPTLSNGVMSGFSTSNYLDVSYSYKSNNATYVFKFTPTAFPATGASSYLVHSEKFLDILMSPTGILLLYTFGNDKYPSITSLELNKTYWVKVKISGTSLQCSISTDGINYTVKLNTTDTGIDINNTTYPIRIGLSSATTKEPFLGSIDLRECYMETNNVKAWTGLIINTGTPSDYDFTKQQDVYLAVNS